MTDLYLGSAELRANALFNNFEIGIRTTDDSIISSVIPVLELVWNDAESCKAISREEVEQRIRTGLRGTKQTM